jgi:hypothetical protein
MAFLNFGIAHFHGEESCTLFRPENTKKTDYMDNIPMYRSEDIHKVDLKDTEFGTEDWAPMAEGKPPGV